jgi:hypothetical protein
LRHEMFFLPEAAAIRTRPSQFPSDIALSRLPADPHDPNKLDHMLRIRQKSRINV